MLKEEQDEGTAYTITIGNDTDKVYLLRARDDSDVEAALEAAGISKHRSYVNVNGEMEMHVSYTVDVFSVEGAEYMMQKFEEILPELFSNEDKEYINRFILESINRPRKERSADLIEIIRVCWRELVDITLNLTVNVNVEIEIIQCGSG